MTYRPLDRIPAGQHGPALWAEHMRTMARTAQVPMGAGLRPSALVPGPARPSGVIIAHNASTATIEAGFGVSVSGYDWDITDDGLLIGYEIQVAGPEIAAGTWENLSLGPLVAAEDVPADTSGAFYYDGVFPAIGDGATFSTDGDYRATVEWGSGSAELTEQTLGEYQVHAEETTGGVQWLLVERVPWSRLHRDEPVIEASFPAKITAVPASLGGLYDWQEVASDGSDLDDQYAYSSSTTTGARNVAEDDSASFSSYTASVPDADIPSGWTPVHIRQHVTVTLQRYHRDNTYDAFFSLQSPISGSCS
jgi:hypothetical protein